MSRRPNVKSYQYVCRIGCVLFLAAEIVYFDVQLAFIADGIGTVRHQTAYAMLNDEFLLEDV